MQCTLLELFSFKTDNLKLLQYAADVSYSQVYLGSRGNLNTQIEPGFDTDRRMHTITLDSRLGVDGIRTEARCDIGTTRWKESASS